MTMYVVSASNRRLEPPLLDMISIFSTPGLSEDNWRHSFSKSPMEVLITDVDQKMSLVLKVRGYVHDVSSRVPLEKRITEVFVGRTRVPVISTRVVGKKGNKVIVDVGFMVSVSDVKSVDESSWAFHLSVPHGFNSVTMCSPLTQTTYLCALVEEPSAMAMDVSPVSFTLVWPHGTRVPLVKVNSRLVDTPTGSPDRIRVGALPETEYVCEIDNGHKRYEVVLQTPVASRETYETHYRSCRIPGDSGDVSISRTYDLSQTESGIISDLRRYGVISPGDRVILGGSDRVLVAVGSGETISEGGCFYVIPSFEEDSDQYLCMETPEGSHVVSFDNTESFVGYNSNTYFHGDKFLIGSRMVEVVKGSLILIVHDDAPLVFPGGVTTASQVATAGDIVLRDLILKSSSQVTSKVSGDFTYGNSSYYVYDSVNGTTLEATRVRHGLDDSGNTGSMTFNVLYTPSSGTQVLHDALEVDPSQTRIKTIDLTGSLEATFDSSGLRFNSDSGDVYFGASQEFRIHYESASGNDPAMLQIQGYNSDTGSYVTRQLITNEPVG